MPLITGHLHLHLRVQAHGAEQGVAAQSGVIGATHADAAARHEGPRFQLGLL